MTGLIAAFNSTDAARAICRAETVAPYRGMFGFRLEYVLAYGVGSRVVVGAVSLPPRTAGLAG